MIAVELQWGRGCVATEILPALLISVRAPSFNGAVAV